MSWIQELYRHTLKKNLLHLNLMMTLNTHSGTVDIKKCIELLVHQVDSLTIHSYTIVAKSQARYLKARKTDIDQRECLILLNFAKNYHYVIQDEIQGYQWNKQQCTLHPVVLYHKN